MDMQTKKKRITKALSEFAQEYGPNETGRLLSVLLLGVAIGDNKKELSFDFETDGSVVVKRI